MALLKAATGVTVVWAILAGVASFAAVPTSTPSSPTLRIGDPAPPLQVMTWIQGEPVTRFEPGHVYVVELWATWCEPCRAMMAPLTSLQKKYAGRLTVVGVDAREADYTEGKVTTDVVAAFVRAQGDKMRYAVAMDDPVAQPIVNTWLNAAGLHGIPATFVVDKAGRVVWIGNPLVRLKEFDSAIEQAVNGTSDLARARGTQAKLNAETAERQRLAPLATARANKDYATLLSEADRIVAANPADESKVFGLKLIALLHTDENQGLDYAKRKAADAAFLATSNFARIPERFIEWAASIVANEEGLSRNAYTFAIGPLERSAVQHPEGLFFRASLAHAYFAMGAVERAVSVQQAAIREAEKRGDVVMRRQLKRTLETWGRASD